MSAKEFRGQTFDPDELILDLFEQSCKREDGLFQHDTTQVCSSCGVLSDSRPKGIADLGIREWTCECGVTHDRDVNAAKNILARGLASLVGGTQHA